MEIMKLETANRVLNTFACGARIEHRQGVGGGFYVHWPNFRGGEYVKRWHARGQDFYPTWSSKWCGGGTSCTALSQLIRWLRGEPVLPIGTWRHWGSERVKLVSPDAIELLLAGGYPEKTPCVLCGGEIKTMDWWSLNGVSGPCCGWDTGCRQKPDSTQPTSS